MAYTALYRKFRPLKFNDMVGQEHITKTIRNQIMAGRVGHAYLFNGGRGTGKTTTAKILARAVNCLNPQDGEPCNECEICKAALSGSLTDIVEMDAASNNSVDDIRAIRDEVNFLPTLAKFRVYIIDEVHMLSTGAFNALLKTLEEPPAHVKFLLATTEPQKLPATILSRCQRFDFKKISNDNISKRLQYVCDESKIKITNEALKIISVLSEGAMRDALSILERCLQEGSEQIDENLVKDLVGIPKLAFIHKIVNGIADYNIDEAIESVESVISEGKDLQNLLWEMIKYVKDILVVKANGKLEIYSKEEIEKIEEIAKKLSKERLFTIIYELSELENQMKWSTQKNILFQVTIIKLCSKIANIGSTAEVEGSIGASTMAGNSSMQSIQTGSSNGMGANAGSSEEIMSRIARLENEVRNYKQILSQIASSQKTGTNGTAKGEDNAFANMNIPPLQIEEIADIDIEELEFWPKIVNKLKEERKMLLASNLINTKATMLNDMTVGIVFMQGLTPFVKSIMEKPESITELTKLISIECKKEMRVKILDNKEALLKLKKQEKSSEEEIKEIGMPVDVVDE